MKGGRWQATPWWRLFGSIFVIVFVLIAIWSIATPLLSGPDEPTHVVKAAAVARGQFVGSCPDKPNNPSAYCPKSSAFTEVRLPEFFAYFRGPEIRFHGVGCFAHRTSVPASCFENPTPKQYQELTHTTTAQYQNLVRNAWIYDGRYPPLYYAIVGIPSLLGTGLWTVYLMRLFSAAASALLLSAALFSIIRYSSNRLLLFGVAVAATPMVIYLSGVVNANGLEVASAVCFWTIMTILLRETSEPPRSLIGIGLVSSLIFVSTRSLSPLWMGLAVIAIALCSNWQRIRTLVLRRDIQIAIGLVIVVTAADLFWIVYEHSTALNVGSANAQKLIPPPGTSELTILRTSFHHNIYYLPGMIGVFGAFDTYALHTTYVIWYLLGGALFLLGLFAGDLRRRLVLVAVAFGIIFLPVLISSSQVRHIGYVWSGRDTLPFAVGLPILCASILESERVQHFARRCAGVALVLAYVAQVLALFWVLRRYSVGGGGPRFSFLIHSSWAPPVIGVLGAVIIECVVLGIAYLLIYAALGGQDGQHRSTRPSIEYVPSQIDQSPID